MSEREKNKLRNYSFGYVIAPVTIPMYVLQMARSKSWTIEAQIRNLHKFAEGCREAADRADHSINQLKIRKEDTVK